MNRRRIFQATDIYQRHDAAVGARGRREGAGTIGCERQVCSPVCRPCYLRTASTAVIHFLSSRLPLFGALSSFLPGCLSGRLLFSGSTTRPARRTGNFLRSPWAGHEGSGRRTTADGGRRTGERARMRAAPNCLSGWQLSRWADQPKVDANLVLAFTSKLRSHLASEL